MKKSTELKQKRASKLEEIQTLLDTRTNEKREFTPEEETQFDSLEEEARNLATQVEREERAEEMQRQHAANNADNAAPNIITSGKDAPHKTFSLVRGMNDIANNRGLSGIEKEVHDEASNEMRAQGLPVEEAFRINVPLSEGRAQTVSDDSGTKGSVLVPSTPQLVQPLQPNLPIADLGVTVMGGLVGDVPLPTSGTFTFSYVGETEDVAATDVTMAGPTLKPKRCSGVVEISKKLLLQTSFSVEQYIINLINNAYGNAITRNAISGPGTNAPTGLYDLITTNINTTAGVPTHATIVDLESLIDAADATSTNRAYLSDTKLRALMKTTKVDAGSGIFLSNGDELNGYNYMASTLVGTLDSGASHPLIFGDWAQMYVGYWGNISIMVDSVTKASAGKVRLIVDGYSDVQVTNEKAFAINKVMTLS